MSRPTPFGISSNCRHYLLHHCHHLLHHHHHHHYHVGGLMRRSTPLGISSNCSTTVQSALRLFLSSLISGNGEFKKRFCSLMEDADWTPWLDMLNCRTFRGRVLRHSSNNPGCLFWSGRFDLPPSESWLLQFWKTGNPLFSSSSICTRVLVFCNLSALS